MSTSKKPTLRALSVHKRGGFTIRLNALPLGDTIILVPPKAAEEVTEGA